MVPQALLSQTSIPLALRRPFTEFAGSNASVSMQTTMGVSDYHALTVKTQHRYSNGTSWIATFVWAKWVDTDLQGGSTIRCYLRVGQVQLREVAQAGQVLESGVAERAAGQGQLFQLRQRPHLGGEQVGDIRGGQ